MAYQMSASVWGMLYLLGLSYIPTYVSECKESKIIHLTFNTGGMYHEPSVYKNPSIFNPDRFLESQYGTCESVRDEDHIRRSSYPFGSGRVGSSRTFAGLIS